MYNSHIMRSSAVDKWWYSRWIFGDKGMLEDDRRDVARQAFKVVCYGTFETMVSVRTFRNSNSTLFWTIPWYSNKEVSLRMTESSCACIIISGTSCRSGSLGCILRKITSHLISWIRTRIAYLTSLSNTRSIIVGCGLLKMISFGVSSIRAVFSLPKKVKIKKTFYHGKIWLSSIFSY